MQHIYHTYGILTCILYTYLPLLTYLYCILIYHTYGKYKQASINFCFICLSAGSAYDCIFSQSYKDSVTAWRNCISFEIKVINISILL